MSHSQQPLEFFLDRSLGRHHVAQALRSAGWILRTHHEVCTETATRRCPTSSGSNSAGARAFPFSRRIGGLRYRPSEIDAIRRFGVRAFVLTGGSLRAVEQAARFDRSRQRIEEACAAPGPLVYAVYADRIVRIFP